MIDVFSRSGWATGRYHGQRSEVRLMKDDNWDIHNAVLAGIGVAVILIWLAIALGWL